MTLESYNDTLFGFMRLEIGGGTVTVSTYTVAASATPNLPQPAPTLFDRMVYDWRTRTIVT